MFNSNALMFDRKERSSGSNFYIYLNHEQEKEWRAKRSNGQRAMVKRVTNIYISVHLKYTLQTTTHRLYFVNYLLFYSTLAIAIATNIHTISTHLDALQVSYQFEHRSSNQMEFF